MLIIESEKQTSDDSTYFGDFSTCWTLTTVKKLDFDTFIWDLTLSLSFQTSLGEKSD
jgi:hypothetical protein